MALKVMRMLLVMLLKFDYYFQHMIQFECLRIHLQSSAVVHYSICHFH